MFSSLNPLSFSLFQLSLLANEVSKCLLLLSLFTTVNLDLTTFNFCFVIKSHHDKIHFPVFIQDIIYIDRVM